MGVFFPTFVPFLRFAVATHARGIIIIIAELNLIFSAMIYDNCLSIVRDRGSFQVLRIFLLFERFEFGARARGKIGIVEFPAACFCKKLEFPNARVAFSATRASLGYSVLKR